MNHTILIGRLTSDPDIRATQSNTTVASYTLAVDRGIKTDGQPATDWIDCVAFGKSGDFAAKYLRKGTKIAIEGRIQTRTWEDKQGNKRKAFEVIIDRHEFCESKGGNSAYSAEPAAVTADEYDDCPF